MFLLSPHHYYKTKSGLKGTASYLNFVRALLLQYDFSY